MASVFTKIIDGEIPGTFVWRDELCAGFMTIAPLRPGHTLVVPVEEIDHWLDLPGELRSHLFDVSAQIGRAVQTSFEPRRVGLMIAGLEVPHAHIHVVPIDGVHDLDFANADDAASREEIEASAEMIRNALRSQGASGVSD
ncbi:MAG: HIT family protein [Actinobacteria bacterium]|nr:MAG: HIT family protein [Actinomycetota bacterium]REK39803.1 MAG: HIT family protein [Actinomycetota bacterium]